jgi:hypothetical protein
VSSIFGGRGGNPSAAASLGYANALIPVDRIPPRSLGTRSVGWKHNARITRSRDVIILSILPEEAQRTGLPAADEQIPMDTEPTAVTPLPATKMPAPHRPWTHLRSIDLGKFPPGSTPARSRPSEGMRVPVSLLDVRSLKAGHADQPPRPFA